MVDTHWLRFYWKVFIGDVVLKPEPCPCDDMRLRVTLRLWVYKYAFKIFGRTRIWNRGLTNFLWPL